MVSESTWYCSVAEARKNGILSPSRWYRVLSRISDEHVSSDDGSSNGQGRSERLLGMDGDEIAEMSP